MKPYKRHDRSKNNLETSPLILKLKSKKWPSLCKKDFEKGYTY